MPEEQDNGLARTILGLGEERLGELIGQLLANERFVGAMQAAVTSSLGAKKTVDKNLSRMFALANVPTLEDVDELRDKLGELEDVLGDVHDRIRHLSERVEAQRPGAAEPMATKRAPARKKAERRKKAT